MAKKDATLNVGVDDNGDLKKLERKAKSAGKALDKGAKGAHSMDRQLRGAASMSSGASKNFSKMSQGISGGLVPAYATLAASLFAIDAAFRALKRASDLRVQQQGMEAYASTTGIALKSIAKDLQAATGFQLDFKEAAESVSIAISAGFSADQITAIGSAAKMASIALGRDFADSYQRLLKGITKAEPELLDELGIILRLEKATKVYGAAIGKNAKDLTAYERQQAVFNEVITQTATKYAAVGDSVPVSVMGQLGATFTDLTDKFLKGIAPIAEFFGSILVTSTTAAIAAMGVFAASILKNVIPPLDQMLLKAGKAWGALRGAGAQFGGAFMGVGREFKRAGQTIMGSPAKGLSKARSIAQSKAGAGIGGAGMKALRAGDAMTPAQQAGLNKSLKHAERQWKKHGAIVTGNWKGQSIKMVRDTQTSLNMMQGHAVRFFTAVKIGFKSLATVGRLSFKMLGAAWKMTASMMRVTATVLGAAMNKALGIIGWIGMLFMAKDIFIEIGNSWDKILKSIGSVIQGIGTWIEDLGKKMGPNSKIGWLISKLGQLIGAGGTKIVVKGEELAPALSAKRRAKAFADQGKSLSESMGGRTTEVQAMKKKWASMQGVEGFSQRAAEVQMLASTGGVGDFAKLGAMRDKATAKEKEIFQMQKAGEFTGPKGVETQRIMNKELASMRETVKTTTPALTDHYKELGKTDKRYLEVAASIEAGDTEGARKRLVELTNEYGSHTQALKDMASAEEGRSKRIAEYIIKTESLTRYGLEVKAMAKAIGELSKEGFDAEKDLQQFWKMFPEAKHIKDLGDAIKYVNEEAGKQFTLAANVRAAQAGQAAAYLGVGIAASGGKGARKKAQEEYGLAQQRVKLANLENESKQKVSDLEVKMIGTTGAVLESYKQRIQAIKDTVHAEQLLTQAQAKNITDLGKLETAFKDTFENSLATSIEGLIMGTMSLSEAFASMAKSILASMAKIVAELLAEKLLRGMFGDWFGGSSTVGSGGGGGFARYGGVFSSPGYKSFASGGIASGSSGSGYLAKLHGTEAVVPLGNDRSIPVKMQGGAMNTNNTSVTVNVEGGQASSSITGEQQGAALGKLIAASIEQRLVNESRPGGLLANAGGGG